MKQIENEEDYMCASNEKTQPKLKAEKYKKFFNDIKFYINSYMPDDVAAIFDSKHPLISDVVVFKIVNDELMYNQTIKSVFKSNYAPYQEIQKIDKPQIRENSE